MQKSKFLRRGFGLIEVVISAGIIALTVGASVALGRFALRGSVLAADRIVAYNIAQEGLELTRSIRDTAWVDENALTAWNTNLSLNQSSQLVYSQIAPGRFEYRLTPTSTPEEIKIGGQSYSRTVLLSAAEPALGVSGLPGGQSDRVEVHVTWTDGGRAQEVVLYSFITNWRPEL